MKYHSNHRYVGSLQNVEFWQNKSIGNLCLEFRLSFLLLQTIGNIFYEQNFIKITSGTKRKILKDSPGQNVFPEFLFHLRLLRVLFKS